MIPLRGSKEISKQFAGIPLLNRFRSRGTEIAPSTSRKVGNLFTGLKISKQQSIYLGQAGAEWLIAEGRGSFHSHRGVVNENKITESCLGNSARNVSAAQHGPAAAVGHPGVSWGSHPALCVLGLTPTPPLPRALADAQALSLLLVPCVGRCPSHFWGKPPVEMD